MQQNTIIPQFMCVQYVHRNLPNAYYRQTNIVISRIIIDKLLFVQTDYAYISDKTISYALLLCINILVSLRKGKLYNNEKQTLLLFYYMISIFNYLFPIASKVSTTTTSVFLYQRKIQQNTILTEIYLLIIDVYTLIIKYVYLTNQVTIIAEKCIKIYHVNYILDEIKPKV